MARNSLFLILLVTIFLCPTTHSHESDIDKICKKHKDPHFCMTFLKEKRESEVPFVAQYSIAAGIAYASENKDKFNSLRHKTSDNELSEDYKLCAKHYHTALVNLKKAEMFLESEDFGEVNVSTVSAVKSLNECGSLMGRGFDETISKRHTDLIYVADIIFDTASVLLNTSSSATKKTNKIIDQE